MPLSEPFCMMLNLAEYLKTEIQTEKIFLLQYVHLQLIFFRPNLEIPVLFPLPPRCHFIIYYIKWVSNYGLL